MKICYIINRAPCPPSSGTPIRLFNIGRSLQAIGSVNLIVISKDEIDSESKRLTLVEYPETLFLDELQSQNSPSRFEHEMWGGLGAPYPPEIIDKVKGFLRGSDLIWIARASLAERLEITDKEKCIVDLDDLNQQLYSLTSKHAKRIKDKLRWYVAFLRSRSRELRIAKTYGTVVVCSENDKNLIKGGDRVQVVPNGFNATEAVEPVQKNRVGFIGTLNYSANRLGLQWFLQNCWSDIYRDHPHLTFRIVGEGEPIPEFNLPGVEHLGYIKDVTQEWASWKALIVPILFGGGTRIKILEAFSRKCPVVSTSIGAYGLGLQSGVHYTKADTPADFQKAIDVIESNYQQQLVIADVSHALFTEKFTWLTIQNTVQKIVLARHSLSKSSTQPKP